MAQSIRTYVGDGVRTLYPVDFDLGYLRREFVFVYSGEHSEYETQLDYVWVDSSQIELATPVPLGQEFYIRRIVPRNELINDYEDGAVLKEKNLDDSFVQPLMVWEELADGFYDVSGNSEFNTNLNMLGNKIFNVTVDTDLPNSVPNIEYTSELIDEKIASAPEFDPSSFIDYGLVSNTVNDTYDYGSI